MTAERGLLAEVLDREIEAIRRTFGEDWLIAAAGKGGTFAGKRGICPEEPSGTPAFEPESHGFTEICFCASGSFHIAAAGACYGMGPGDLFLLLPGAVHNEVPGRDYSAAWLSVDYGRVVMHLSGRKAGAAFTIDGIHVFRPDGEYMRQIDAMRSEMAEQGSFFIDSVKAGVLRLLVAARRELASGGAGKESAENWKDAIVFEVISFIKDNLNSYIRLCDVAQAVCVSPNYLNVMFKASTGKTIIQYHEDCRMEIAKGLLADPSLSVNEISSRLGYYDQYHFSRAFKKACGKAPTAYRAG